MIPGRTKMLRTKGPISLLKKQGRRFSASHDDPIEYGNHFADPLTAWQAFAAGFFLEELHEIPGDVDHARILIHHDHSARTHH